MFISERQSVTAAKPALGQSGEIPISSFHLTKTGIRTRVGGGRFFIVLNPLLLDLGLTYMSKVTEIILFLIFKVALTID